MEHSGLRTCFQKLMVGVAILVALASTLLTGPCIAQDEMLVEDGPLIDQRPFDLIHLTDEAGPGEFKVMIIPFPGRVIPKDPQPAERIQVVLMKFPERKYEIAWKSIAKIELFEDMIMREAQARLEEKDFIGAFQNLSFMMRAYPNYPRLKELRQDFLWRSLTMSFQGGQYAQMLSALEELRRVAPTFREKDVMAAMNRIARTLVEDYEKKGDLASAKALLTRLMDTYGEIDVVKEWKQKIENQARAKQSEAEQFFKAKRYRDAQRAAAVSLSMFPELEESKKLLEEINRIYPLVRVGVMQRCGQKIDPSSLMDWAGRRAGGLSFQPLFQFRATGNEGGDYGFALGSHVLSDDRKQLILTIDPKIQKSLNAFGLAQILVDKATPDSPQYDPSWAAIFDSVEATGGTQLIVNLQRPNVLPHALLQWTLPDDPTLPGALPGPYLAPTFTENEASFKLRPNAQGANAQGSTLPMEIVEIFYADPKEAINDLIRGDIDMIDQLYPSDAKRLASESRLQTMSYALPTTHMLIPLSEHPYLVKEKFRRALMYATNRQSMLQGELLKSSDPLDGRLISGPFPKGLGESDPLAYAYNDEIEPISYNPQLAKLLVLISEKEIEAASAKLGQPKPELKKLVIGCPDFEFARVAVQAMIQQWEIIGVPAESKVLPPDAPADQLKECDLIYVITTMWEPATDIERLLGASSFAVSSNPFVVQGLERVRAARNWKEIRDALQDMHRIINYHLPLLPLWQVTDRFVLRKNIEGVSKQPISLYQSIKSWRVKVATAGK